MRLHDPTATSAVPPHRAGHLLKLLFRTGLPRPLRYVNGVLTDNRRISSTGGGAQTREHRERRGGGRWPSAAGRRLGQKGLVVARVSSPRPRSVSWRRCWKLRGDHRPAAAAPGSACRSCRSLTRSARGTPPVLLPSRMCGPADDAEMVVDRGRRRRLNSMSYAHGVRQPDIDPTFVDTCRDVERVGGGFVERCQAGLDHVPGGPGKVRLWSRCERRHGQASCRCRRCRTGAAFRRARQRQPPSAAPARAGTSTHGSQTRRSELDVTRRWFVALSRANTYRRSRNPTVATASSVFRSDGEFGSSYHDPPSSAVGCSHDQRLAMPSMATPTKKPPTLPIAPALDPAAGRLSP